MDPAEWRNSVGTLLRQARGNMSKREAAKRAGFSEVLWRQLEAGERQLAKDVRIPVSPLDETLEAAARAVGLDPAEVFRAAGREWEPSPVDEPGPPTVEERLAALERQVDELVDRAMTPEEKADLKKLVRRGQEIYDRWVNEGGQ